MTSGSLHPPDSISQMAMTPFYSKWCGMATINMARYRVPFMESIDDNWNHVFKWVEENLSEQPRFSYDKQLYWAIFVDPEQAMRFKLTWGI